MVPDRDIPGDIEDSKYWMWSHQNAKVWRAIACSASIISHQSLIARGGIRP